MSASGQEDCEFKSHSGDGILSFTLIISLAYGLARVRFDAQPSQITGKLGNPMQNEHVIKTLAVRIIFFYKERVGLTLSY
jgi:hypothetical protein